MPSQLYIVEAHAAEVAGAPVVTAYLNQRPDPAWSEMFDREAGAHDAGSLVLDDDRIVLAASAATTAEAIVDRVNTIILT